MLTRKDIKKFDKEAKEEYLKIKRKSYHGDRKKSEEILIKSSKYATLYAVNVIKKRWKEAEKQISYNKNWAYIYITNIFQNKFPDDIITEDNPLYDIWYQYMENKIFNTNPKKIRKFKPTKINIWGDTHLHRYSNPCKEIDLSKMMVPTPTLSHEIWFPPKPLSSNTVLKTVLDELE